MRINVNTADFDKAINKTVSAYQGGVLRGVGEIILRISARADELVPFDTGVLSGSQTKSVKQIGPIVEGEVGYGGPASAYALVQHEDVTLSHPPKSKGGSPVSPGSGRGPKYLEYPTKQIAKKAEKIIADSVRKAEGVSAKPLGKKAGNAFRSGINETGG